MEGDLLKCYQIVRFDKWFLIIGKLLEGITLEEFSGIMDIFSNPK